MSLTVLIHAPPADLLRLTFDARRIVIGRGASCDVRLPDPSVSHRHAIIEVSGETPKLVDEGSTNGTWVGGVRLTSKAPRLLRSGDRVRVGRVWFEIRIDQTPPTRELASATRELALALVARAMSSLGHDTVPKLLVVEGPDSGTRLPLVDEARAYVIGRSERCDLPLADPDASREHVVVVRRGEQVLVRDAGSKNGVLLGESPLPANRDVLWRGTTMLRAGATVLALEEPVAEALGELETLEDEPVEVAADETPPRFSEPQVTPARELEEAAAITEPVVPAVLPAPPRRSAWSGIDVAVVAAAALMIALSVVGLFWLLRP